MNNRISRERELASFLFSRVRGLDRLTLGAVLLGKLSIVIFDLAGIFLVGAVLAVSTGTVISPESFIGRALSIVGSFGFSSASAGLLLFAIAFFCIKAAFAVGLSVVTGKYSARVEQETSKALFKSFLQGGFRTRFIQSPAKTSMALTTGMSTLVGQSIVILTTIVGEAFLVFAIAVSLAVTNLLLFVTLSVFFILVTYVLHLLVARKAVSSANTIHRTNLETQTLILDVVSNFRFIATSKSHANFLEKYSAFRKGNSEEFARYQITTSFPRYVLEVSVMVGASIIFLAVAIFGSGIISAATVGIYVAGLFRLVSSILPLQSAIVTWSRIEVESRPTRELASELLIANEGLPKSVAVAPADLEAGVEINLKNVSFQYTGSEHPVLVHSNLNISAGELVAIVGESGTGKSTLADLILGLQIPNQGTVTLDGLPARTFLANRPGSVSYMPQETKLVAGTLFENIAFSFDPPSEEDLAEVSLLLHNVGLGSLEHDLPHGLMSEVGNGAREFSGGQVQRIGLARALFSRPCLLVLDEPTSALDESSEVQVLELIKKLAKRATIVVISHSTLTPKLVDRVFRVSSGSVVEEN